MRGCIMGSKRNPIANDLHQTKYRQRRVPARKRDYLDTLVKEELQNESLYEDHPDFRRPHSDGRS
jgi:hypothetical protein